MLSMEQIVSMADDQGKKAKRHGLKPYLLKNFDADTFQTFPFPNIGSYVPSGWELVTYKTVDKTGMGYESEPALTIRAFVQWIKECKKSSTNFAMAIIEEGEFQVVIGLFKPDSRDFTHSGNLTDGEMKIVGGDR
jgi:hypothetical protein